jgi:hypothetical protein
VKKRLENAALDNLYIYAQEVCGFKDLSPALHGEICERIQDAFITSLHNQAVLIPRDFFKSSIGLATVTWLFTRKTQIENNYEWRTMIDTETMTLAKKHLGWIARHLTSREYTKLYGEVFKKGRGSGNGEIFVNQRATRGGVHREPNFMASSERSERTGLHFDFHWYDDLVGERNWHTSSLRQKSIEHFYSSLNLLEPGGLVLYTATPWHDNDLTGKLIRAEADITNKNEKRSFHIYKRAALEDEKRIPDENFGESTFPERWPTALLQEKRKMMERAGKRFLWRAQQMIDPCVPEEAIPFDRDSLYAPRANFPNRAYLRYISVTVDPNFRTDDMAAGDYAAIVVGGFDHKANWWGIDVRMGRWNSEDFIEQLFDVNKTWRPHMFRMEKKFTSHLMSAIRHRESIKNEAIPMTFIERDWRSKEMRYTALRSIFGSRRIKFASEIGEGVKDEMEDELSRLGTSAHDDFLDALMDQFTGVNPNFSDMEGEQEYGLEAVNVARTRNPMSAEETMGFTHMTEARERKDFFEDEEEDPWQLPF